MARGQKGRTSSVSHQPTISPELALNRLQRLLDEIPKIQGAGHSSNLLSTWMSNVKIVLADFHGEASLPFKEFNQIWFSPGVYYDGQPDCEFVNAFNSGLEQAKGFLESRVADLRERVQSTHAIAGVSLSASSSDSRRVFVVHGHDHGIKEMVARFLAKLELDPIILHEQADQGRTLIEKFLAHATDVRCAVVILTADDIASPKANPDKKEHRARQNVVLELGFFVGMLGRDHTFALVEKGITLPSDIHGLVYIPLDDGEWRLRLVRELKATGLDVDANRAF